MVDQLVDFKPTFGNILSGVGPAAIEMGLMPASDAVTKVRIKLVNTGAFVDAHVQTQGGKVCYEGDTGIDGVPGTAARIDSQFMDVIGSVTGHLLPTTSPATINIEHPCGMIDVIVDYTCDDRSDHLGNAMGFAVRSAGLIRTARKLAAGTLCIYS